MSWAESPLPAVSRTIRSLTHWFAPAPMRTSSVSTAARTTIPIRVRRTGPVEAPDGGAQPDPAGGLAYCGSAGSIRPTYRANRRGSGVTRRHRVERMAEDTEVASTAQPQSGAVEHETAHPETTSHDIPLPAHLREAIARDWDPAPPMPHPARPEVGPHTAKRRTALSALFPGQLIVVPAGELKVRANDTDYEFRAASSFTWLTGETAADAVLVMTPHDGGHDSTLYVREYAQPGEVQYFTSRIHGAVWVGNVPSVADTATVLDVTTRPLAALPTDLAARRDDRAAVLRGYDSSIDALL